MRKKVTFVAIGLVAALTAGGTAYAATSSGSSSSPPAPSTPAPSTPAPSTPATSTPAKPRPAKGTRSLLGRADHATAEVKVKGQWVTYTVDRGKVSAVGPTSITLARPDGQNVTESIDSTTRFRGAASETQIQTNRAATVVSDNGAAVLVQQKLG